MVDSRPPQQPNSPSEGGTPPGDLAGAYAELQNLLIERPDVNAFLQQVAGLAGAVLPDVSCGITMRHQREVATVASSDDFALAVDEIQYGRGQGPCLETLHTGHPVSVPDLAVDGRWGEYRIHALIYGVRSSLSLPLTVEGKTLGALNLYSRGAHAFGSTETARSEAFAAQAAAALTVVLRNADQIVLERQLREALATRAIIDQAVGIVMGQRGVNAAAAFAVLREASQSRNRKMRDIAAELIQSVTGEPPRPPRPFTDPR